MHRTLFLYSIYSSPNIDIRYVSSFFTNACKSRYMNIGIVIPSQLARISIIPGTKKTIQAAYTGFRQRLNIPEVMSFWALYARWTDIRAMAKKGTPMRIRQIPIIIKNKYGIKSIGNCSLKSRAKISNKAA
jgi:hypothetical protein